MPTQECIWLYDVKGLLPKFGTVGKENEPETIGIGNLRSLDLPVEDNQLLAEHSIFNNQIVATASQVTKDACDQR